MAFSVVYLLGMCFSYVTKMAEKFHKFGYSDLTRKTKIVRVSSLKK